MSKVVVILVRLLLTPMARAISCYILPDYLKPGTWDRYYMWERTSTIWRVVCLEQGTWPGTPSSIQSSTQRQNPTTSSTYLTSPHYVYDRTYDVDGWEKQTCYPNSKRKKIIAESMNEKANEDSSCSALLVILSPA